MNKTLSPDPRLLWVIFICLLYLLFSLLPGEKSNTQCLKLFSAGTDLRLAACVANIQDEPDKRGADLATFFFEKMPINLASREVLETVSGIGPYLAKSIIDYRTQHGSIDNVDELRKIKGIGEKRSRKLLKYITF